MAWFFYSIISFIFNFGIYLIKTLMPSKNNIHLYTFVQDLFK